MSMCAFPHLLSLYTEQTDGRLTIAGAPGLPLVKAQQKIPLWRGRTLQNGRTGLQLWSAHM